MPSPRLPRYISESSLGKQGERLVCPFGIGDFLTTHRLRKIRLSAAATEFRSSYGTGMKLSAI